MIRESALQISEASVGPGRGQSVQRSLGRTRGLKGSEQGRWNQEIMWRKWDTSQVDVRTSTLWVEVGSSLK